MKKRKYLVSVVTPIHKASIEYIRRAYFSLKTQSIGYENIEWIIVAHNCEEGYIEQIRDVVGKNENTIIEVLNDTKNTPSSPRNHAIDIASAPYIAFLDADDSYDDRYLEKAVSHMEKTGSQMAVIRRKFIFDETEKTFDECSFWDTDTEEIVVERKSFDFKKLLGKTEWTMVTSKVIRKSLLDGIRFNESISHGEDVAFCIECFFAADKICFLPSYVGYKYFIHKSSIIQTLVKPAPVLKKAMKGLANVFDTYQKFGILSGSILLSVLAAHSVYMMYSSMEMSDRVEIKEVLCPYIEMISHLPVPEDYTQDQYDFLFDLISKIILQPEQIEEHKQIFSLRYPDGHVLLNYAFWGREADS